jgi:hypothetical protein
MGMDMNMINGSGHAAWTHRHGAWTWTCTMDMYRQYGHAYGQGHAEWAWTWICSMDMDMLHGLVHAAWMWSCSMDMDMQKDMNMKHGH